MRAPRISITHILTTTMVVNLVNTAVASEVVNLPGGNAARYGKGGGKSFEVKDGPFRGLRVGGGKRSEVYGNTHHPTAQTSGMELRWGFLPLDKTLVGTNTLANELSPSSYYGLPLNDAYRPGGAVVQIQVHLATSTPNPSFFVVSDLYTANEVRDAIGKSCGYTIGLDDPVPYNQSGNIGLKNVVQFYRGDSAAILLQDYDNTKEITANSYLSPNPPLPTSMNKDLWDCLNNTVGESIPLMGTPHKFPAWIIAVCVLFGVVTLIACGLFCCLCVMHRQLNNIWR